MDKAPIPDEYVCPNCGTAPRGASECRGCGIDLDSLAKLPRHRDYIAGGADAARVEYIEKPAEALAQAPTPGGLWDRIGASIVDTLVVVGVIIGLGLAASVVLGEDGGYTVGGIVYGVMLLLYAPTMLAFAKGQTVGKRALGVRVRNATGEPIGFGRAFLRELLKLFFGLITLGVIVSGLVGLSRADRRTLHDLMLGTEVIEPD